MNIDAYKIVKKLLKYYLIYHLVFDLYILWQFAYYYFSASQSTWYHRIIDNPVMLIDLLITGPISAISEINSTIIKQHLRKLLCCFLLYKHYICHKFKILCLIGFIERRITYRCKKFHHLR